MEGTVAALDSLTLKVYYSSFRKQFSGILAIITTILPLGSLLSGYIAAAAHLFPPLGDSGGPARVFALVLVFFATYAAFFAKDAELSKIRKIACGALLFALVSLCAYIGLHMRFVRQIPIPTRSAAVWVSVGYERTASAQSTFGAESDWELLRARGFDEEQVSQLWTSRSLLVVRLALFLTYCGVLMAFVLMFSLGVVYELKQRRSSPTPITEPPA